MTNRYAVIQNGIVVNVVLAHAPLDDNWVETNEAGPGWTFDDGEFLPPAPPKPEPRTTAAGWFKAALSQAGKLSAVNAAVATLPEWKRILWDNATSFREDDADVIAIAAALQIDLKALFDRAEEIRTATRG